MSYLARDSTSLEYHEVIKYYTLRTTPRDLLNDFYFVSSQSRLTGVKFLQFHHPSRGCYIMESTSATSSTDPANKPRLVDSLVELGTKAFDPSSNHDETARLAAESEFNALIDK